MITLTKEEAQQVLDALEPIALYKAYNGDDWPARQVMPAIETLRAALARGEQEPVADGIQVIEHVRNVQYKIKSRYHLENGTELYTAPPQRPWQGLTDEERQDIMEDMVNRTIEDHDVLFDVIEAKLKEKNT